MGEGDALRVGKRVVEGDAEGVGIAESDGVGGEVTGEGRCPRRVWRSVRAVA
jgi:hypothetical protein